MKKYQITSLCWKIKTTITNYIFPIEAANRILTSWKEDDRIIIDDRSGFKYNVESYDVLYKGQSVDMIILVSPVSGDYEKLPKTVVPKLKNLSLNNRLIEQELNT